MWSAIGNVIKAVFGRDRPDNLKDVSRAWKLLYDQLREEVVELKKEIEELREHVDECNRDRAEMRQELAGALRKLSHGDQIGSREIDAIEEGSSLNLHKEG